MFKRIASLVATAGITSTVMLMGASNANATILNHYDAYRYSSGKVAAHTWLDVSWDSNSMTISNFGDKDDLADGWGAELIVEDYAGNVDEHLWNSGGAGTIVRSSTSRHYTGDRSAGLILYACSAHSSSLDFTNCAEISRDNEYN
jgi:hypothetical protein